MKLDHKARMLNYSLFVAALLTLGVGLLSAVRLVV